MNPKWNMKRIVRFNVSCMNDDLKNKFSKKPKILKIKYFAGV